MKGFFEKIQAFSGKRPKGQVWKRFRMIVAMIVVFTTTYSLILPVIALEKNQTAQMAGIDLHEESGAVLNCAFEAHKHTKECYEEQPVYDANGKQTGTEKVLICGRADWVVHEHDDNCYDADGNLICTLPEIKEHKHDKTCYTGQKVLTCGKEETSGHKHTAACYKETKELTCGKEEHVHTEACYSDVVVGTEKVLTCGHEEGEVLQEAVWSDPVIDDETGEVVEEAKELKAAVVHHHTGSCYRTEQKTERQLTCGKTEHRHNDKCYTTKKELTCGQKEGEAHKHTAACYTKEKVLTCGEHELHTHTIDCYEKGPKGESPEEMGWVTYETDEDGNKVLVGDPEHLICGKLEVLAHQHTEACFAEAGDASGEQNADGTVDGDQSNDGVSENADNLADDTTEAIAGADTSNNTTGGESSLDDESGSAQAGDLAGSIAAESISESSADPDAQTESDTDITVVTDENVDEANANEAENPSPESDVNQENSANLNEETKPVGEAATQKVPVEGASYEIEVSYGAESGIPSNASFKAVALTEKRADYEAYRDRAFAAVENFTQNNNHRASEMPGLFDLTIYDEDGNEIQPAAPVTVKVDLGSTIDEDAAGVFAVHFSGTDADTIMRPAAANPFAKVMQKVAETITATGTEVIEAEEADGAVSFQAEGFSVYAIVYTVDFSYSVNGEVYDFSLPGGEKIKLSELIEVLGIIRGTQFESVNEFIEHVSDVEFSDSSLVKVTPVKEGGLFGIGAKTVDWELESLQAFDTEESLTIIMDDGSKIVVNVTDAMDDSAFYTTLDSSNTQSLSMEAASNAVYNKDSQNYAATVKLQFQMNEKPSSTNKNFQFALEDGFTIPDNFLNQEMQAYDSVTKDPSFSYKFVKEGNQYFIRISYLDDYIKLNRPILMNTIEMDINIGKEFLQDDGSLKGQILDDVDLTVPTDKITYPDGSNGKSDISINKTFGGYDKTTNKMMYTVLVSSVGGTEGAVSVEDVLSINDGQSDIGLKSLSLTSVKSATGNAYYQNPDTLQDVTGYTHTEDVSSKKLTVSNLPKMDAGKVYILEYEYELSDAVAGSNDFESSGSNTAKASTTPDLEVETSTNWNISKSGIALGKNGNYDSAQKNIVWTINVTNNTDNAIPLTDEAFKNLEYADFTFNPSLDAGAFDKANGQLTIPANSSYTITYWGSAALEDPTKSGKVSNTVTAGTPGNGGKEVTGQADVPAEAGISKQFLTVENGDGNTRTLKWRVTINVPNSGFKAGTKFEDALYFEQDWNGYPDMASFTDDQKNSLIGKIKAVFGDAISDDDITYTPASKITDENGNVQRTAANITFTLNKDWADSNYTGKQIVLEYETTANLEGLFADKNIYRNTFKLGDTEASDTYSFKERVVKKSDPGVVDDVTYKNVTSEDKKLHWIVQVHLDKDTNKITVTDTLPDGIEKVTAVAMGSGENLYQMTGLYSEDDGVNWVPAYSWGQGVAPWQYSSYAAITPSAKLDGNTLTITADAGQGNVPEFFKKNENFYFYIEVALNDSEFPEIGTRTDNYKNTVSITLDDSPYGSDDQTQVVTKETEVITKGGDSSSAWNTANGAHEITYTVDINPSGAHLCKDEDGNDITAPITLTDSVSYYRTVTDNTGTARKVSLNLKEGSAKLQRKDDSGNWVDIPATEGWGFTLNEDAESSDPTRIKVKEINVFGIPDDTILRFVYTYNVEVEDLPRNATVNLGAIRNTATLHATFEESSSHTETKDWKNVKSSASTDSTGSLTLVKVQEGNYAITLPDTYFVLEKFVPATGDGKTDKEGAWEAIAAVGSEEADPTNTYNFAVYKTDKNGKLTIAADPRTIGQEGNFAYDQLYRVREYTPHDGYTLEGVSPEAGYFYFSKQKENNNLEGLNFNGTSTHADNLLFETDTLYMRNSRVQDTITAKKQWNSSSIWPSDNDIISIEMTLVDENGETVEKPDGYKGSWNNPQVLSSTNAQAKWEGLSGDLSKYRVVETKIIVGPSGNAVELTGTAKEGSANEYIWTKPGSDEVLYETFGGKVTNGAATIVNMGKTKLDVEKQWASQDGLENVNVVLTLTKRERLYAQNGVIESVLPSFSGAYTAVDDIDPITLDGKVDSKYETTEAWKSTFSGLNKFRYDESTNSLYEIEYSVQEQVLQNGQDVTDRYLVNYTTSNQGQKVTVTNSPNVGELAVKKVWQRANAEEGHEHDAPAEVTEITISLERYYKDETGARVDDRTFNTEHRGITITANSKVKIDDKETTWAVLFENLQRQVQLKDGTFADYHYVVKEDTVDGYTQAYSASDIKISDGSQGRVSQITVTNVENTVIHNDEDIEIKLHKNFTDDEGEPCEVLPDGATATFRLYRYVKEIRANYDLVTMAIGERTESERKEDTEFNAAVNDDQWTMTLSSGNDSQVKVEDGCQELVDSWNGLPIWEEYYREGQYVKYIYEYYVVEKNATDNNHRSYTAVYLSDGSPDKPVTIDTNDGYQYTDTEKLKNISVWNFISDDSFTIRKYWLELEQENMPGVVVRFTRQKLDDGNNPKGDMEDVNGVATSTNGSITYNNQKFTMADGTVFYGYLLNNDNAWNLTFTNLEDGYQYSVEEVGYYGKQKDGDVLKDVVIPFDTSVFEKIGYRFTDDIQATLDSTLAGRTYAQVSDLFSSNDGVQKKNSGTMFIGNLPKRLGYQLNMGKKWYSFTGTGGFADISAGYTGKGKGNKPTKIYMQVYSRPYWATNVNGKQGQWAEDEWTKYKNPIEISSDGIVSSDYPEMQRGIWDNIGVQESSGFAQYGYLKNDQGVYELVSYDYKWIEVDVVPGDNGKSYRTIADTYQDAPEKDRLENPNYYHDRGKIWVENFETGWLKLIKDWKVDSSDAIADEIYFTVVDDQGRDIAKMVYESEYKDQYGVSADNVMFNRELDKYVFVLDKNNKTSNTQWELLIKNLDVVRGITYAKNDDGTAKVENGRIKADYSEVTYTVAEVGAKIGGTVKNIEDISYPYTATYYRKVRLNDEQLVGNTAVGTEDGSPLIAGGLQLDSATAYDEKGSLTSARVVNSDEPHTNLTVEKSWPNGTYPDQTMKIVLQLQQRQQATDENNQPLFEADGITPQWASEWTAAEGTSLVSVTLPRTGFSGRNAWTYNWRGLPIYKVTGNSGTENEQHNILWYRVIETSSPDWTSQKLVAYDANGNKIGIGADMADFNGQTGDSEHPIKQGIENSIDSTNINVTKTWKIGGSDAEWPEGYEIGYKIVRHAHLISVNDKASETVERKDLEGNESSYEQRNVSYSQGFEVEEWKSDPLITGTLTKEKPTINVNDLPKGAIIKTDDNPPSGLYANYTYAIEYEYEVVETSITYNGVTTETNVEAVYEEDANDSSKVKATITNELTNIEVEKIWSDGNENHSNESVKVQLYRSSQRPEGKVPATQGKIRIYVDPIIGETRSDIEQGKIIVTVTGDNGYSKDYKLTASDWSVETDELPDIAEATGSTINYTVTVKSVDGKVIESASVVGDATTEVGGSVRLTAKTVDPPQMFTLNFKDDWCIRDYDNWSSGKTAPTDGRAFIRMKLAYNGTEEYIRLDTSNDWGKSLNKKLYVKDASGNPITYTISYPGDNDENRDGTFVYSGLRNNLLSPTEFVGTKDGTQIVSYTAVRNQDQQQGGGQQETTIFTYNIDPNINTTNIWGYTAKTVELNASKTWGFQTNNTDVDYIKVDVSGATNVSVSCDRYNSNDGQVHVTFTANDRNTPVVILVTKIDQTSGGSQNTDGDDKSVNVDVQSGITLEGPWDYNENPQIGEIGEMRMNIKGINPDSVQISLTGAELIYEGARCTNNWGDSGGEWKIKYKVTSLPMKVTIATLDSSNNGTQSMSTPVRRTLMTAPKKAPSATKTFTILGANDKTPLDAVEVGDPVILSNGNWSYKWEDLPTTDEDGNPIYYYVREISATVDSSTTKITTSYNYTKHDDNDARKGYSKVTVTNEVEREEPQTTEFTIQKRWMTTSSQWNAEYNGGTIYYKLYKIHTVDGEVTERVQVDQTGEEITSGGVYELKKSDTEKVAEGNLGGDKKYVEENITQNVDGTYTIPYMKTFTMKKLPAGWDYTVVECDSSSAHNELRGSNGNQASDQYWTCNEFNGTALALKNNLENVIATKTWTGMTDSKHPSVTFKLYRTEVDILATDTNDNGALAARMLEAKKLSKDNPKKAEIFDENGDLLSGYTYMGTSYDKTIEEDSTVTELTWKDLPSVDLETGKKYVYIVVEDTTGLSNYEYDGVQVNDNRWGFTNKLAMVEVEVEKKWVGDPPAGATVTLSLSGGDISGRTIVLNGKTDAKEDMSEAGWNSADYEILGEQYVENAHESQKWHASWYNLPKYDSNGGLITYTVTETASPTGYSADYTTTDNTTAESVILTLNNEGTQYTGELTNVKRIDLNLVKVDKTDKSKKLPGAQFTLVMINGEAESISEISGTSQTVTTSAEEATKGTAKFEDLAPGYYQLTEDKTPDGYVITTDKTTYLEIKSDGTISVLTPVEKKAPNTWAKKTLGENDMISINNSTITVKNEPGVALPSTGGRGTTLFTILGSILVLGAGFLLWRRRIV